MKAVFTAIVENLSTRSDKTLKITLGTSEQTPETKSRLFELHQKTITVLFSSRPITEEESIEIEKVEHEIKPKGKTPSQRLRAILYRNWEADNKGYQDSNDYYNFFMERIIEFYKNKLD